MGLCKAPAATMPQCFLKCLLPMAMAVRMGKVQGPNDFSGASEGGGADNALPPQFLADLLILL